ncbi:MAG TPA: MAPEG family protein [Rhizomicrobium sp.]|nr:MAPEG family protein [Rhizomicrobium sp.]
MAMPATLLTAVVTILAILFVFYTGIRVGQMRTKHGVAAPATSGHPEFDCAYRVQMNTLEQFVIFLPLLWLATSYFKMVGWLPAALGLVWLIGRILYMQGYMKAPDKRGTGFGITALATLGLLILAVIGIVMDWNAVTAG